MRLRLRSSKAVNRGRVETYSHDVIHHDFLPNFLKKIYIYNVSDRVMTVSIVLTVPTKFRLCVVLMFQIVITMPTVIVMCF